MELRKSNTSEKLSKGMFAKYDFNVTKFVFFIKLQTHEVETDLTWDSVI